MGPPLPLLIEIGTEELPLTSLDLFYAEGREKLERILTRYRLDFQSVRVEATPRRFVFFVGALASRQKEEKVQILGPTEDKAYDSNGVPTLALQGFLKAQGIRPDETHIRETPRGRYVSLEKIRKGESILKLLPRIVPELLAGFSFPKTMQWEESQFRFPRPIRWVVVLYGKRTVAFSIGGIRMGSETRGHRFLSNRRFRVKSAESSAYEKQLRQEHVVLAVTKREAMIRDGLRRRFHQKDFDVDLVHENAQLVEDPFLIQGKFSGTYRELPEEVLSTCMKKHQKIFACRDGRGGLMNRFVAVLNGRRSGLRRISQDYENVLESRLRDAQYFYHEDTKEPLVEKAGRLKEIAFLGKLGTMEDRVKRLRELARTLGQLSGQSAFEHSLERVAQLAKVDLVTHMVGEFPELQGIMGREYAGASHEAPEVVHAIGEQYLPRNLGDSHENVRKKMSVLGALFGIVDRMDLLVGAFGVGLDPTGSEDPYALRRAGGVLVKLVRGFAFRFPLVSFIQKSYSLYTFKLGLPVETLSVKVLDFLRDRVTFELQAKPGTRAFEILQGVMRSTFNDLADVFERYRTLLELSSKDPKTFFKTSKVVERTSNILKGVKEKIEGVDPGLFQDPLEKELFRLLERKAPELEASLKRRDYEGVARAYGETFYLPLHDFFDRVMVNVEESSVRRNRQALMKRINTLFTEQVADLSVLTQLKEETV